MSHDSRLDSIDHHGRVAACADCSVCGLAYVVDSRPVEDGEDEGIAFVVATDVPCPQCEKIAASMPLLHELLIEAASLRGVEDAPSGVVLGGEVVEWVAP